MKTAVVYCRVSDARQIENFSLGTQEKACREYCARNEIEVVAVYRDEGESASTADRPQFRRALDFCREHKIDAFVVYALSRFARSTHDHAIVSVQLRRHGTTLHSATEPIGDSATGRLMEDILASFAAFDNRAKSERTSAGMRAALSAGRWAWQPPLGYGPGMTHDPERAPIVRRAFELAASGDYTGPELREKLAGLGLLGKKGRPVSKQTLASMLRNGLYAGIVRSKKWGVETDGAFEPIVDRALFFRVQHVLDGRAHVPAKGERLRQNPDFPLRGFASCEKHGKALSGAWSRSKTGKLYGYYRCLAGAGCVNVGKIALENDFEAVLAGMSLKPSVLRLFREITLDVWRKEHAEAELRRAAREKQVAAIRARKDRLVKMRVDGEVDEETYRKHLLRIESETDFGVTGWIDAEIDERTLSADLDFAEHVLGDLRRAWVEFDLDQKQRFDRIIFPAGIVVGRGGKLQTPVPSALFESARGIEFNYNGVAAPTGIEPVLRP